MARGVAASAEALVAGGLAEVFDAVVAVDPSEWYPRFGPLPAVVRVTDQSAAFTEPGARRTLHLSDGGTVTEEVVTIDAPRFHSYQLTGFQKLFGHLVRTARADWVFSPDPRGVRIRWTYTFYALRGRGVLVSAIVLVLWAAYMRRVLPPIARNAGPLLRP
jgi:hypothetical protein